MTAATDGMVVQVDLLADADVEQHLWIRRQIAGEIGQRPSGEGDGPQDVERGTQAVPREEIVREDDVARLLAAERQPAREHLLHHVLVADGGAHQIDAARLQRQLETDIAHDGRDDRSALQTPFALQLVRAHQQHRVAIHDLAAVIDEDGAIAVAVERDAHLEAPIDDGPGELLGMRGPAAQD